MFHSVVVLSYSVVGGNVVLTVYMYVGGRSAEMAKFVVTGVIRSRVHMNERFDRGVSKRHLNPLFFRSSSQHIDF